MNKDRQSPDKDVNKVSVLLDIIKRYDHYVGTTNVKAALLLSFVVAISWGVVNFYINSTMGGCPKNFLVFFILLLLLSCLISSYFLIDSIFPSSASGTNKRSVVFYMDVAKSYKDKNDYFSHVNNIESQALIEDLSGQVYDIAKILCLKFKSQRIAVVLLKYISFPSIFAVLFINVAWG